MANACLGEDAECFDCSQFRYTKPGLDLFTKEDQTPTIFLRSVPKIESILKEGRELVQYVLKHVRRPSPGGYIYLVQVEDIWSSISFCDICF